MDQDVSGGRLKVIVVICSDASEASGVLGDCDWLLSALAGVKEVMEPAVQVFDHGEHHSNTPSVEGPAPNTVNVLENESRTRTSWSKCKSLEASSLISTRMRG